MHMNIHITHYRCSLNRKCYHICSNRTLCCWYCVLVKSVFITVAKWLIDEIILNKDILLIILNVRLFSSMCTGLVSPVPRARLLRRFRWIQQPRWLPEHLLVSWIETAIQYLLKKNTCRFSTQNMALSAHTLLTKWIFNESILWGIHQTGFFWQFIENADLVKVTSCTHVTVTCSLCHQGAWCHYDLKTCCSSEHLLQCIYALFLKSSSMRKIDLTYRGVLDGGCKLNTAFIYKNTGQVIFIVLSELHCRDWPSYDAASLPFKCNF